MQCWALLWKLSSGQGWEQMRTLRPMSLWQTWAPGSAGRGSRPSGCCPWGSLVSEWCPLARGSRCGWRSGRWSGTGLGCGCSPQAALQAEKQNVNTLIFPPIERSDQKQQVTSCFTPSQPLRLYQGERPKEYIQTPSLFFVFFLHCMDNITSTKVLFVASAPIKWAGTAKK